MRIVDLSMPIVPSPPETPDLLRTEIEFLDHERGAAQIRAMFGVGRELLRDGEGWSLETFLRLGTHSATHVDAPYHYNSTIQGERAQTIDELPLDRFYGPGLIVEARDREDGDVLTTADVQDRLPRRPDPGDIVLVRTGRDRFGEAPDYMTRGPGVSAAATRWLYEQGVRLMGIDAWGWDRPLHLEAEEALESGDAGVFWAAHQVDLPYSQIERLANLDAVPDEGFTVAAFPLRIVGASAAPARVVAFIDD